MKVTVIVPIYNVEKYLAKCLDSIINQTYNNLEIILINDGSKDTSLDICKAYEKKDKRIILIDKKNEGLSAARNDGLDKATGNYVAFIDSDDYIDKEFIEELLNANIKNNTKISQCGLNLVLNNKIIEQKNYSEDMIKTTREVIYDILKYNLLQNESVCNKLYDASIFKNLRFEKGKLHEDDYINYKLYFNQKYVSIISSNLYNYRQEGTSITSNFYEKRLDGLDAIEERIKFFDSRKDEEFKKYAIDSFLKYLRNNYFKVKEYLKDNKDICDTILDKYKHYYKLSTFGLRKWIFRYFPNMYFKLKKTIYKLKNKKL